MSVFLWLLQVHGYITIPITLAVIKMYQFWLLVRWHVYVTPVQFIWWRIIGWAVCHDSSMVRALTQWARDLAFKSRMRHDFSATCYIYTHKSNLFVFSPVCTVFSCVNKSCNKIYIYKHIALVWYLIRKYSHVPECCSDDCFKIVSFKSVFYLCCHMHESFKVATLGTGIHITHHQNAFSYAL